MWILLFGISLGVFAFVRATGLGAAHALAFAATATVLLTRRRLEGSAPRWRQIVYALALAGAWLVALASIESDETSGLTASGLSVPWMWVGLRSPAGAAATLTMLLALAGLFRTAPSSWTECCARATLCATASAVFLSNPVEIGAGGSHMPWGPWTGAWVLVLLFLAKATLVAWMTPPRKVSFRLVLVLVAVAMGLAAAEITGQFPLEASRSLAKVFVGIAAVSVGLRAWHRLRDRTPHARPEALEPRAALG